MLTLKEQYEQLHEEGKFPGNQIVKYADIIKGIIDVHGYTSWLDYGCGKAGYLPRAKELFGLVPYCYDPYWRPFSYRPVSRYDLVTCVDVAEHIPENEIQLFIMDLYSYAAKHIFLVVAGYPAKKTLPDGRNAHLTVKPREWWEQHLSAFPHALNRQNKKITLIYEEK